MAPSQHVTISVGSGVIFGLLIRSWVAGVSCCLVGILIDLDHVLEFWVNRGFRLSVRDFLEFTYHGKSGRFFDLFHGYELIPLFWYLTRIPGWQHLCWGLTLGYTIHLLSDQFFNNHLSRWTYFFSYRLYHRFDAAKIVLGPPRIAPEFAKLHSHE